MLLFYAEQRSNKRSKPEDQDPEHSVGKDTPGLLHKVINLSPAEMAACFISFILFTHFINRLPFIN